MNGSTQRIGFHVQCDSCPGPSEKPPSYDCAWISRVRGWAGRFCTNLTRHYVRHQTINVKILDIQTSRPMEHTSDPSRTTTEAQIAPSFNAFIFSQRLSKAAIGSLHLGEPGKTFPPLDSRQVISQHDEGDKGKEGSRHIGRVPMLIFGSTHIVTELGAGEAAKASTIQLAAVDPGYPAAALLGLNLGVEYIKQIKGRDNEKGQSHAIRVIRGVWLG